MFIVVRGDVHRVLEGITREEETRPFLLSVVKLEHGAKEIDRHFSEKPEKQVASFIA
jgi:hypothetical protein